MSDLFFNRIRILKTGLANVQQYLDMDNLENRLYFERLAEPGTELRLKRVQGASGDPFKIEVYSLEGVMLGRVTMGKNETVARLMDAGQHVIAIVNESLPIHDSDDSHGQANVVNPNDPGWNGNSRASIDYSDCNLPYSIYLVDD